MIRRGSITKHEKLDLCSFCYPSGSRNIIYEDEHVYIMPALGNFVRGYVLMINKRHRDCFAGIINDKKKKVKDDLKESMKSKYGSCCLLEHGRVGSCMSLEENRICYHAHMHAIPTQGDFRNKIEKSFERIDVEEWKCVNDIKHTVYDYLYVEADSGGKSIFKVNEEIERQYLKKKACTEMNIDKKYVNWQKYPFRQKMKQTYADMREMIN